MHVAIVEDDDMISDILKTMLMQHGFQVSIVANAFAARKLAQAGQVDLFLSDLQLPDGSGVDLCREFMSANPECKAILMSGSAAPLDLADLLMKNNVAVPILQKPFLLSRLMNLLLDLCGNPENSEEDRQLGYCSGLEKDAESRFSLEP